MTKKLHLISSLAAILLSCAAPGSNYRAMSEQEPEKLIAMKDSLMAESRFSRDTSMVNIIVSAHLVLSEKHVASGKIDLAIMELEKAVALNPDHKPARYRLYMQQGKASYNHGNVWKLWDAITLYTKASEVYPLSGEPWYWMGRAYEKKDDRDFESILESYQRAASLLTNGPLLEDTKARIVRIQKEKNTFENFWK